MSISPVNPILNGLIDSFQPKYPTHARITTFANEMLHADLPVDDGDHVKQPEDDPRAEAEDGETGERYVQRGPRSHGHRREKLQGFPQRMLESFI